MPIIGGIVAGVVGAVTDVGAAIAGGIGAIGADVGAGVAAADVGAGVAAADVGAGVAAADVAGATALPEILVTPGVAGAEAAGLTGAEAAGAAGLAAGGVTAIPEAFGGGAAGGAIAPTEALAGAGAGGALAALSPSDVVGGDFAAMQAAGIGPSVDLTAPALAASDVAGTGIGDTALSFASSTGDPLANVAGGGGGGLATDPFAGAPAGIPGSVSSDFATALNTGAIGEGGVPEGGVLQSLETPGGLQAQTAATGIPTPTAPLTDIPATIGPGATPGAPLNLATAAPADIGSTIGPGTDAGVSPGLGNLFSGSTLRTLSLAAPLAGLGLTLARGQPSLPPAMQQALNNLGPAQNLAAQQLQEGASGQITPAQIAQIDQYKRNAKNQLYQLYASMGRNPQGDTDYIQGLATIDANAIAMQQQFIDSAIKNGLAAQGVVDSTLQAAAGLQVQQDQAFQASLTSAMSSFGLVAALNVATSRTT